MTDNMLKLQALINESKKIREDVKAETKQLNKEHDENKKKQYQKLHDFLLPYCEMCKGLQPYQGASFPNVYLPINENSKFKIKLETYYNVGVSIAGNGFIGRFDLRNDYFSSRSRVYIESNYVKTYYLDELMDEFNESVYEQNFTDMVTSELARLAKEVDDDYQNAKTILENDKEY